MDGEMTEVEYQQVIDELERLIQDTRATMARFESSGMDEQMPEDYDKLLVILDDAVKQQREHTLTMLDVSCLACEG
jgi:flagellar biosynthesis chaperone FliJ